MADEKAYITLILDDKEVTGVLKGMPSKFGDAGDKAGASYGSRFKASFKANIKGAFSRLNRSLGQSLTNMAKLQTAAVLFGSAFFLKSAIAEAAKLERAMRGLNSVAANYGVDTVKLNETIQDLAADGMIPLSEITEAFKNSLRSTGGQLELTVASFKSFRDSATNNREAQYSLGEAIVATTQGVRNQMSVKSDAIGVTENLSIVNKKYAASLGKNVSQLTDQQKQLGSTIGLMKAGEISTGDYARSLNDFDGIMSKVSGEFKRFQQNVGRFVTKSPTLLKIFKDIGTAFGDLNKDLSDFINKGGIKEITLSMLSFAKTFTQSVLKPISFLTDVVEIAVKSSALLIQGLLLAFIGMANGVGKVFKALGFESPLLDSLQGLTDATMITAGDMKRDLEAAVDGAFSTEKLDKITAFVNKYISEVSRIKEAGALIKNTGDDIVKELGADAKAMGNIVKNGIVKMMSSAMQELGRTLVQGGFSFKTFGAIVISALGDLAIQMGTMIIAADSAMAALQASVVGVPGKGIVYGAALIAIGGAMKAFSGGMGGGGSSASSASSGGSTPGSIDNPTFTQESPVTREDPGTQVVVNIQGDILDGEESAKRIANILNDSGETSGIVINRSLIA